jgi:hypothetical protein
MSRTSDDCRALAIIIQRSQPLQHGRAFGSPDRSDETGLPIHRSEKMKASREGRTGESILSSAVREEKFANWRAFREDFNELRPEFASAQTAWRRGEGFELSVRFWAAKPRRVRKLQRGKPEQRISYQNSPRKPSPPSGFDSPSIRNVKANARRSCCKWSRGECYCPTWLTPDCLPSGQFHRREGLSLPLRLIFFPKVCLEQFAGSPHAFLRHHNRFCFAPRVLGLW